MLDRYGTLFCDGPGTEREWTSDPPSHWDWRAWEWRLEDEMTPTARRLAVSVPR